ncbi:TrsD/TraD family conjugative transfer protein [Thalassorhabdus alkalitolerans]|uniref:TrsD/TraD family conjugative transfer protein n=1 Tax=Thalassorhabdus alkalitolerans TaxID=2282697 RepID=A0ABW0YSD4_9BACI
MKKPKSPPNSISQAPKKLKNEQDQTIQDMSLIKGQYLEYIVLKDGYLVAALKTTGINMQLFNQDEQTELFHDYASFLNSMFSGNSESDSLQLLDTTVPIDMKPYLLGWKKRYLMAEEANDPVKQRLIASYINHFEGIDEKTEMTTKQHLFIIKEKIKEDSYESLEFARKNLDDKVKELRQTLESTFENYHLEITKLDASEYKEALHHFTNFIRQ